MLSAVYLPRYPSPDWEWACHFSFSFYVFGCLFFFGRFLDLSLYLVVSVFGQFGWSLPHGTDGTVRHVGLGSRFFFSI